MLKRLAELYPRHPLNVMPQEPFQVLVATILSSRTKDPTTNAAMDRLWPRASDPEGILRLTADELAELIKPVGFYRNKASQLREMSRLLLERFAGQVPRTREELIVLPGVGRKVANLVLNICFDLPAICVDTHVHRLSNRLGWVETDTPEETEQALMEIVPRRLWSTLNRVMVNHGQQVCNPVSPRCSTCPLAVKCPRIGVVKSR
ncbi:endonuclease III [bacterium]|nr:endonuclease III [bacterium]